MLYTSLHIIPFIRLLMFNIATHRIRFCLCNRPHQVRGLQKCSLMLHRGKHKTCKSNHQTNRLQRNQKQRRTTNVLYFACDKISSYKQSARTKCLCNNNEIMYMPGCAPDKVCSINLVSCHTAVQSYCVKRTTTSYTNISLISVDKTNFHAKGAGGN